MRIFMCPHNGANINDYSILQATATWLLFSAKRRGIINTFNRPLGRGLAIAFLGRKHDTTAQQGQIWGQDSSEANIGYQGWDTTGNGASPFVDGKAELSATTISSTTLSRGQPTSSAATAMSFPIAATELESTVADPVASAQATLAPQVVLVNGVQYFMTPVTASNAQQGAVELQANTPLNQAVELPGIYGQHFVELPGGGTGQHAVELPGGGHGLQK
jgi:hypothetical protein